MINVGTDTIRDSAVLAHAAREWPERSRLPTLLGYPIQDLRPVLAEGRDDPHVELMVREECAFQAWPVMQQCPQPVSALDSPDSGGLNFPSEISPNSIFCNLGGSEGEHERSNGAFDVSDLSCITVVERQRSVLGSPLRLPIIDRQAEFLELRDTQSMRLPGRRFTPLVCESLGAAFVSLDQEHKALNHERSAGWCKFSELFECMRCACGRIGRYLSRFCIMRLILLVIGEALAYLFPPKVALDDTTALPIDLYGRMMKLGRLARIRSSHVYVKANGCAYLTAADSIWDRVREAGASKLSVPLA